MTSAEASCCDMPLLVSMQPFYAGEQSGWAMREVFRVGLDTHYDPPEPRLCCFIRKVASRSTRWHLVASGSTVWSASGRLLAVSCRPQCFC